MNSDKDLPTIFKDEVIILLNDYIEIKKVAVELGYDQNIFKFPDYLDAYIKRKNN